MKTKIASLHVAAFVKVAPDLRAGFGANGGGRSPGQPARRSGSTTLSHHVAAVVRRLAGGVTTAATGLVLGALLLASGCGNRAQQQAYERAVQAEQHLTVETAPALIADYRRVIALEPDTAWARQAGERIAAVEARVKAEELHKAVFQEHGVD